MFGGIDHQEGPIMSRPRRRLFGPLLYSTLVVAVLAVVYTASWQVAPIFDAINDRRELASQVELLRAADPVAREQAARLLVTRGPAVSLPILRDAARDPRGEVRALACRSLVQGGGEPSATVPVLTAAAGDDREDVRIEAARGLGRVVVYCSILKGSRSASGESGGWTPTLRDEALGAVRRLLKDRSSLVRAEAAGALAEFGPDPSRSADLIAAADEGDRAVRLAAARALVKVNGPDDPASARTLIALVASPDAVPDRPEVLRVVRTMGEVVQDQAVAALVDLLSHGDPDILPDVLACLPEAGPRAKAAVPILEEMLNHAEPALRAGAAMAIVAIESPGGEQTPQGGMAAGMTMGGAGMMGTMAGGTRMGTGAANLAVGAHANPKAMAALIRIIVDAAVPRDMRDTALAMARGIDEPALAKASPDLIRQLADPDPNVRRTAIDLLARIIDVAPADLPAASRPK
jgi:HEAT repeat protein